MKDFGIRLQFSIFMCRLDAGGVSRCREKLKEVLKTHFDEREPDDSLIIFERFHPDIADCLLGTRIDTDPAAFGIF
jgi:CRISPR/Cas system-associated endoribonuclease Cas2